MFRKGIILIIGILLLEACSSVPQMKKKGIIAYGFKDDIPMYDSISINLDKIPNKTAPRFCLKLDQMARPLHSDQLTENSVSNHLPKFVIPHYWPESWKEKAREADAYEGNGFYIVFKDGVLKTIGMGTRQSNPDEPITNPVSPAIIGPIGCEYLYPLPITRAQFVEIFGEPDKENMVREVSY